MEATADVLNKIGTESDRISKLCERLKYQYSWVTVNLLLIRLVHMGKNVLRNLDKLNRQGICCLSCDTASCDIPEKTRDLYAYIQVVSNNFHLIIEKDVHHTLIRPLSKKIADFADEFDDRIENYVIGADAELHDLASAVAARICKQ